MLSMLSILLMPGLSTNTLVSSSLNIQAFCTEIWILMNDRFGNLQSYKEFYELVQTTRTKLLFGIQWRSLKQILLPCRVIRFKTNSSTLFKKFIIRSFHYFTYMKQNTLTQTQIPNRKILQRPTSSHDQQHLLTKASLCSLRLKRSTPCAVQEQHVLKLKSIS